MYNTFIAVFMIGLIGTVYNLRNFLLSMMSLELTYLGIIALLLSTSTNFIEMKGRVIALAVLAVTASESALGLGILVSLFRSSQDISFSGYEILHY